MTKHRKEYNFSPSSIESLSPANIEEIILASDAQGMREAIALWAQIPVDKQKEYFQGEYEPLSSKLIPENSINKKEFYLALAKKLVKDWQTNPENNDLREKAKQFLEYTAHELFFPKIYAQELTEFGHLVDETGIVEGVNQDYEFSLQNFAEKRDIELPALSKKIGGLTKDILKRAKYNLTLGQNEIEFIDDFILEDQKTDRHQTNKIKLLRMAQEVRGYYFASGLNLEDFMKLWGINKNHSETKNILREKALSGKERDALLTAVDEMTNESEIKESDILSSRAKALNLPHELPEEKEILQRNARILDEIQSIMHYEKITGEKIEPKAMLLTTEAGARSRAVSIAYLNKNKRAANVAIMEANSAEQKLGESLAHELTHDLHAHLIVNLMGGLEVWNKTSIGVREQFSQLTERSMANFYAKKASKTEVGKDSYYPALVAWFQFPHGYSQQRFLEEFKKAHDDGTKLSDEELLAIEEEITLEINEINFMQKDGQIFDLRKIRRASINPLELTDGIAYVISDINAIDDEYANLIEKEKDVSQESVVKKTAKSLMEERWGKTWLENPEAYRVLICAMIQSPKLSNTNEVVLYIEELLEMSTDQVEKILDEYDILI